MKISFSIHITHMWVNIKFHSLARSLTHSLTYSVLRTDRSLDRCFIFAEILSFYHLLRIMAKVRINKHVANVKSG